MNLLRAAIAWTVIVAPAASAQKGIEVTPFIGGQINTGLDLSTARFNRLDVQNGRNYGVSVGYLIGKYAGIEFMWGHNQADTLARAGWGIAQDMLRPIVPERVNFTAVLPFTDVHTFGLQQASLLDVGELRPARAAMDVAVLAQGLPASHDMDCIHESEYSG